MGCVLRRVGRDLGWPLKKRKEKGRSGPWRINRLYKEKEELVPGEPPPPSHLYCLEQKRMVRGPWGQVEELGFDPQPGVEGFEGA